MPPVIALLGQRLGPGSQGGPRARQREESDAGPPRGSHERVRCSRHGQEPPGFPLRFWSWSYRSEAPAVVASGRLLTDNDPDGDGLYTVLAIRGQRNGVRITGLVQEGEGIPGNVDTVTGLPYRVDNQIRNLESGAAAAVGRLSTAGIGYSLADGSFSNLFDATFLDPPRTLDFHSVPPFLPGLQPPNTETAVLFQATLLG